MCQYLKNSWAIFTPVILFMVRYSVMLTTLPYKTIFILKIAFQTFLQANLMIIGLYLLPRHFFPGCCDQSMSPINIFSCVSLFKTSLIVFVSIFFLHFFHAMDKKVVSFTILFMTIHIPIHYLYLLI